MEFVAGLGEGVRVLQGRCLPYGEGITFWAARDIVKQAFEIGDTDSADQVRQRIYAVVPEGPEAVLLGDGVTELLGLSEARVGMEETFWAMRRLLELAAATQPLVLVLDDIHWAEPAFLDLIDYLVGWTEGAPILFLCLGRPELLDARPSWRRRSPREWSVALEPLREEESATLLANLMAQGEMAAEARTRILEAAEGNPLFVEEMLRMLADDDLLRPEAGRWRPVRDLSDLAVPPTINALIGARLDRLGPGERAVTRRASVIGKVFWWGAVAELSPTDERSVVGGHLQTLVRKELVQPERSRMEGEDAFRFHHLLIRDAAYQGTPKAERADLHRRFAGWLERVAADRVAEYEEVIGYHLEQAVRYRAELEPAATKTDRELASRAANRLASAGRRAFGRGDMSAAANLLGRAALLLPADDPVRLNLMPDLAEALMEEGDLSQAAGVLDEVAERAGAAGLARIEGHATIVRLLLAESTDPESRSDLALKELERVIPVFQELEDHLGLARSYRLTADVHWSRARYAACDEALLLAADHARKAGAVREETECLAQLAGSGLYGPAPVAEVVRRCEEIRATSGGRPAAEARALRTLAACVAMEGRFDEGRELANRSYEMLNELGLRLRASFATEAAAFVETLAGDHAAAERALRLGFAITEELGERGYNATVTALLSQAVFAQGRLDEAEALTQAAERNGATDDMTTQVVWRSVRARVLSARGRHADAEALGREAASLAGETDDVNMRADALLDLAAVLRSLGQPEEAETHVRQALGIYEAKGNEVSAERTRALLVRRRGRRARPVNLGRAIVVVTGASSGIGRDTAIAFAKAGASLVLAARREDRLRDLAGEIERHGRRASRGSDRRHAGGRRRATGGGDARRVRAMRCAGQQRRHPGRRTVPRCIARADRPGGADEPARRPRRDQGVPAGHGGVGHRPRGERGVDRRPGRRAGRGRLLGQQARRRGVLRGARLGGGSPAASASPRCVPASCAPRGSRRTACPVRSWSRASAWPRPSCARSGRGSRRPCRSRGRPGPCGPCTAWRPRCFAPASVRPCASGQSHARS